jgi:Spy/CpxP family protein refolding chaperone
LSPNGIERDYFRSIPMRIPRAGARPVILATGLLLTFPLVSFAAPPAGPDGDHNVVCGPGPGFRGPPPGPRPGFFPGGEWGAPPPFLAGLKLTEEQQDKVFEILYAAAPAMRTQSKALHKAHEALMEFNTSDQYDEGRAKLLADTAAKADSQLTLLRIHAEHEIYALLTPEQRKEISDRHHDREAHDHQGRPPA